MSTPAERMSPQDRAKAIALANAGVHDLKHLAQLAGLSQATVWRYWNAPPKRKDIGVLAPMAKALEMDVYDLADLLSGGSAGIRYFAHTATTQHVSAQSRDRKSANGRKSALAASAA